MSDVSGLEPRFARRQWLDLRKEGNNRLCYQHMQWSDERYSDEKSYLGRAAGKW